MDDSEILKIARLARLDLKPEELGALRGKFNEVLNYVNLISEIQDEVPDDPGAGENLRVFHEDEPASDGTLSPSEFSEHAEDGFYKVPKVIE